MKAKVMLVRPRRAVKVDAAEVPKVTLEEMNKKSGRGPGFIPPKGGYINPIGSTAGAAETKTELDAVLAAAMKLPTDVRKQLLAYLALEQQQEKPEGRDVEMWLLGVQSALVAVQGGELGPGHSLVLLKRSIASSAAWAPVADFMQRAGMKDMVVVERQAIYMMLGELLVRHAERTARHVNAPLTAKFIAGQAGNITAIFDAAFPGYLRAGLAPIVAARFTEDRGAS